MPGAKGLAIILSWSGSEQPYMYLKRRVIETLNCRRISPFTSNLMIQIAQKLTKIILSKRKSLHTKFYVPF